MTQHRPYNCYASECVRIWRQMTQNTQAEEDQDLESGSIGLHHCEQKGCHIIYWRGKSGSTCYYCLKDICSRCTIKDKGRISRNLHLYCSNCITYANKDSLSDSE